ncbi:N-acetylmuramoyl-L-alanine amidase family protein [Rossellomorea marisflavi]|uniref:N-acetylmuramoyl-L-alanine amidase family protein n=1 Tax=Rossellomorea marisflavi TaxID=189381 RepID=UPI003AEBD143
MANVGRYLNLMPHMNSWKVYELNTAPVSGNEVGNLAPSTFGGLSYLIIGNPSTDIYTIRTESFGTANIFAPRDDDSSITNVAQFNNESNSTGSGDYLNLQPHMTSWRVYPVGKSPVSGNEAGRLAPAVFGGLSYRIIDEPSPNLYTIETESFGRVNIYAPRDQDSTITNSPEFSNGGDRGSSGSGADQFLNLEPHMDSWRVYPLGVNPVSGNEVGRLAPSRYGGLSYEILGNPSSNLYTILTESFGRVNIYAPRDNDSSLTNSPIYLDSSDGSSGAIHGNYLNLMPHMSSWRVYPLGVPMVAGNEVGNLGPSMFGGLSYRILGSVGANSYTINTESFGRVNIYAPRDADSSITASPLFGASGGGNTAPGGGYDGPIQSNPNGVKIFLDAGHGGFDSGASGYGLLEKNVNLTIVKELGKILAENGANVQFRRTYDTYNPLDEIVNMANNSGADLFISIHCNANPSPLASGTECYTYNPSSSEAALSASIARSISSKLGLKNRGALQEEFRVIKYTTMPAILVETGFISNSYDGSLLSSRPEEFAKAIASEIISYFGLAGGTPELTTKEKEKLIREKRMSKLKEFREFNLLGDTISTNDISRAIPQGEFVNEHPIYGWYGATEIKITCSSVLKTPGNDDTKFTVKKGQVIEGAANSDILNGINTLEDAIGYQAEVGSNGVTLQGIVNEGEIITSFGVNKDARLVLKVAMNMKDMQVQGDIKTSLCVEIEVTYNHRLPQLVPLIPDEVLEKLAIFLGGVAILYISGEIVASVLTVTFRASQTMIFGFTKELLKALEEEMSKYDPI